MTERVVQEHIICPGDSFSMRVALNPVVSHIVLQLRFGGLFSGLSLGGRCQMHMVFQQIREGERIYASRETPDIFRGAYPKFKVYGRENIPPSGPLVAIANHPPAWVLGHMGQFFVIANEITEGRRAIDNRELRETGVLMQKGLSTGNSFVDETSARLYSRAAKCFVNWEAVDIPQFKNGQIINNQRLPRSTVTNVLEGGALLVLAQGTNRKDMFFSDSAGEFLFGLQKLSERQTLREKREVNIQLLPIRIVPTGRKIGPLRFQSTEAYIGQAIPLREFRGDINGFVQEHMAILGNEKYIPDSSTNL